MEHLSTTKYIDIWVPLTSGISGDTEETRLLTSADGEIKIVIRKHPIAATGNPCLPGTPLYMTQSKELLPGESIFQCSGCFSYLRLSEGHEIKDPPPEVIQVPASPEDGTQDGDDMLALRVPYEGKPRQGFCDECWKKLKRRRLIQAVIGFFLNPFKSMMFKGPVPVENNHALPAPMVMVSGNRYSGSKTRQQQTGHRVNNSTSNQQGTP